MPKRLLPFIPASLRVIAVASEPERVTVMVVPRSAAMCCRVCQRHSDRIHGSYERRLDDLPWQGRSVSLRVRLRRLCCCNPVCPRRTFSQSLPDVAVPRARRAAAARRAAPSRPSPRRSASFTTGPTVGAPGQPIHLPAHGPGWTDTGRASPARDCPRRVGVAARAPLRHDHRRSRTQRHRGALARPRRRHRRGMAAAPSQRRDRRPRPG